MISTRRAALVVGLALATLSIPLPAAAATLAVANTGDSGAGSLRQAISDASAGDTIDLSGLSGVITLTSGVLVVDKSLTITGPGLATLTIDGNGTDRVFSVSGAPVTISGVAITNGLASPGTDPNVGGGGVLNTGTLTLSNVAVTNNDAFGVLRGGGIASSGGSLTVSDSTISGNHANENGGGVYVLGGTVLIQRSTISGNNSGNDGGGIALISAAAGTIINSTVSGNSGSNGGGIARIGSGTTITVTNSTVANNGATSTGGISGGTGTTIQNTIIAGNTSGFGTNSCSAITSLGNNLIQATNCAVSGTTTGNLIGSDPLLGTLLDNGGSTLTLALGTGSPAIDAGNDAAAPVTDQRGTTRPQGSQSDIGAFEVAVVVVPAPVPSARTWSLVALAAALALVALLVARRRTSAS